MFFILGFFVSVISCLFYDRFSSFRFFRWIISMQWSCYTDFEISPQQHNMYRRQTKTAHYYDVCHQRPDQNDVENEIKIKSNEGIKNKRNWFLANFTRIIENAITFFSEPMKYSFKSITIQLLRHNLTKLTSPSFWVSPLKYLFDLVILGNFCLNLMNFSLHQKYFTDHLFTSCTMLFLLERFLFLKL